MFMDYYCVWGKGKVIDSWDGMEENYNTSAPVILSLEVNDQGGYLDTTAVEVYIVPVNDSPTINSYTGQDSFDEDNSFTFMLDQFDVDDVDNDPTDLSWSFIDGDHIVYFIYCPSQYGPQPIGFRTIPKF